MAPRRKNAFSGNLSTSHLLQLCSGHDFFGDAFAGDVEAMRRAWADPEVRRATREYHNSRCRRKTIDAAERPVWAEGAFV